MMIRFFGLALLGAFVACASVSPGTYKRHDSFYDRSEGWYHNSDYDLVHVSDGTSTGTEVEVSTGNITAPDIATTDDLTVGDDATVSGTLAVVEQTIGLDFGTFKIFDNYDAPLTNASGDDDDLTYYQGTFGTNAATLESADCGALNDTTQKAFFTFALPPTYVAGSTVSLVANVGMRQTVASEGATLDFNCYVADYANEDGTMSGDLITPAAQSVNSTTFADKTFVIDDDATGYALGAGDIIECQIVVLCDDDGNAGDNITVVLNSLDVVISE